MTTRLNLIFARAANGVIGRTDGDGRPTLPWHLPEDLAHFKRHTSGCPVIMGRHTWESLPPRFRPLPGRLNLVLSRQATQRDTLLREGAVAVADLPEALAHCAQLQPLPQEIWVIGGAQVYAQAEPLAQRAVVTEIAQDFDGDALAPTLGPDWSETQRIAQVGASGLVFDFATYERRAPVQDLNRRASA